VNFSGYLLKRISRNKYKDPIQKKITTRGQIRRPEKNPWQFRK